MENTGKIKTIHFKTILNGNELQKWLESFDFILTDCDGTIWNHDDAIPGAADVLNKLKKCGKQVYYITNNCVQTPNEILQKAKKLGFQLNADELITPLKTIVQFLKQQNFNQNIYVIGNPAITNELKEHGIKSYGTGPDILDTSLMKCINEMIATNKKQKADGDVVGAVIVGWDEHFSYVKMLKATSILAANENLHFLATNLDTVHKYPNVYIPGTGAFVRSIECSVGRPAKEMGKPNPEVLEPLIKAGKIDTKRTLMIGDCFNIDVKFAHNCGMKSLLVGTGIYSWDFLAEDKHDSSTILPDYYVDSLGDLLKYL